MTNTITFEIVTQGGMDALRRYMENSEAVGYKTDIGTVATDCFNADFRYDEKSSILKLKLTLLMKNLTLGLVKTYVNNVLRDSSAVIETTAFDWPHKCAVYNWVICDINNQTEGALTYLSNITDHGQFKSSTSNGKIPGSTTAFRNQGSKDAVTGCYGRATFTLPDGEQSWLSHMA